MIERIEWKEMAATKIDNYLKVRGYELFNALPGNLRNPQKVSLQTFKFKLCKYLISILNKPMVASSRKTNLECKLTNLPNFLKAGWQEKKIWSTIPKLVSGTVPVQTYQMH